LVRVRLVVTSLKYIHHLQEALFSAPLEDIGDIIYHMAIEMSLFIK